MSYFDPAENEPNVSLNAIREGVAPDRRSKAEATTGLAPKKASALNPLLAKSSSEGFDFKGLMLVLTLTSPVSLVEFQRSGGLG